MVLWENKELKKNLKHPLCKIIMQRKENSLEKYGEINDDKL